MEELYNIIPIEEGKIQVSIHAIQGPRNIKSLLENCAVDNVDSIAFQFSAGIAIDYLLLQAMVLLHKNNKKISVEGDIRHSEVICQILQKLIT